MASYTAPMSAALIRTLLAHEGTLPRDLIEALLERATNPLSLFVEMEALLDRRELTPTDIERIGASFANERYPAVACLGRVLARLPVRAGDDALAHRRRIKISGVQIVTLVYCILISPLVREDVLDVLEESNDPLVLATYAHHTPRGATARRRALARLEALFSHRQRLNEDVTHQAACAFAMLFEEDAESGREQLLATNTRPILLALGKDDTPWAGEQTLGRLDEETRAHLIKFAVLPVFMEKAPTQKDQKRASMLVRRLKGHLSVDILQHLAPFLPADLARELGAEVASKAAAQFDPAEWTVGSLAYGPPEAPRPAGAQWLLDSLEDATHVLGWKGLLKLADEACHDAIALLDLRALLDAVAAPAALPETA